MSGASPIPGTAMPEGEVDEEGADERRAFTLQTRVFTAIGLFLFVISVGYAAWTQEAAGSAMLALAGGLATVIAAYLGWPRKAGTGESGTDEAGGGEPGDESPWFPEASIWPFVVAGAAFLVANGLLLGLWLLLPAGLVMFFAVAGFVTQSRRRA